MTPSPCWHPLLFLCPFIFAAPSTWYRIPGDVYIWPQEGITWMYEYAKLSSLVFSDVHASSNSWQCLILRSWQ